MSVTVAKDQTDSDGVVWDVLTLTGDYNNSTALKDILTDEGLTYPNSDHTQNKNLKIIGASFTWTDFKFAYDSDGDGVGDCYPNRLHIEDISFITDNINGYAVYSQYTMTTLSNVSFEGYSGDETGTLITSFSGAATSGRWLEKAGGPMRIVEADYSSLGHDENTPTFVNLSVKHCCRGVRLQDCTGAYIKDCSVYNISDNAYYLASSNYLSTKGCQNCVFDNCTASLVGQVALMSIGGANNTFKNCTMNDSRGAGGYVWNTNSNITYTNCRFTNANNSETKTPWNGNTDDAHGAAFGVHIGGGTNNYADEDTPDANVSVTNCIFKSGADSVFYRNSNPVYSTPTGTVSATSNVIYVFNFSGGVLDENSEALDQNVFSCFTGDAIVATDQGNIPIRDVTTKNTISGKSIKGISRTIYPTNKIVCVEKNAFGTNRPSKRTMVAPNHHFYLKGKFQPISDFLNNKTVHYAKYNKEPLYNIIFENHSDMKVNNMTVESLHPSTVIAKAFDKSLSKKENIENQIKSFSIHNKLY